jgi:hypothetical protein
VTTRVRSTPDHWDPIDPAHGNTTLVLLDATNPQHAREIDDVKNEYKATNGIGFIHSIHRIQNKHLHVRYEQTKKRMHLQYTTVVSDKIVYHGTRFNDPSLIYATKTGFDPSQGQAAAGHVWFAHRARYSSESYMHHVYNDVLPFYTGTERKMQILRARICVNMKARQTHNEWGRRLPLLGPDFYTVKKSSQCYPEYLITYSYSL